MNRGNIKESKLDNIVSQLDRKIGRLLGKKGSNFKKPKETSNLIITIIIICSCLFLWGSTGFYYLNETEYGLILNNGRVVKVQKGLKVGFTLPYPFGSVEALKANPSSMLNIGEGYTSNPKLSLLTKDLNSVMITAKFNYQITNPKQLYLKHLQDVSKLDELVTANIYKNLQSFVASYNQKDLQAANFVVLSSKFREQANQELKDYGIEILKFSIASVNGLDYIKTSEKNTVNLPTKTESLALDLLKEARDYQNNTLEEANNKRKEFNIELIQYHQNPKQTIDKLYQKALQDIPVKPKPTYPLLGLSLAELLNLNNKLNESVVDTSGRNFSREVNRSRDFNLGQ